MVGGVGGKRGEGGEDGGAGSHLSCRCTKYSNRIELVIRKMCKSKLVRLVTLRPTTNSSIGLLTSNQSFAFY